MMAPEPDYEEEDWQLLLTEYEDDDDTYDDALPSPVSTTEMVEESNMQVSFSEMTSREMEEILHWWTTMAGKEDNDNNQTKFAPNNSLLRLEEEQQAQHQATEEGTLENENVSVMSSSSAPVFEAEGSSEDLIVMSAKEEGLQVEDVNEPMVHQASTNLLIDQPLPQDVAFFSPIKAETSGVIGSSTPNAGESFMTPFSNEIPDFNLRSVSSPEEIHQEVCVQHDEVTRLLFQTRDMADKVAALTETSATEDDNDESASFISDVSEIPTLPPPRNLRRRRRKTVNIDSFPPKSTDSVHSPSNCMQLEWHHHCRLFLFRQLMKLEMAIVARVLVPMLPLHYLLRVLHRPEAFRSVLVAFVVSVTVFLPFLLWWHFPIHKAATEAPLPSLNLFLNHQPFYASGIRYSLHTTLSSNPVREVFVEGKQDFVLL